MKIKQTIKFIYITKNFVTIYKKTEKYFDEFVTIKNSALWYKTVSTIVHKLSF